MAIRGVRYKCAICDDTDFCAACEAHPKNNHNKTHPLIKFKTQIKQVTVTTHGEDESGHSLARMGDTRVPSSVPSELLEKTVAPSPTEAKHAAPQNVQAPIKKYSKPEAEYLDCLVADGHVLMPNKDFMQVWTMKNPGPVAWPIGCSVRWVGGDSMLRIDETRPTSESDLAGAQRSNINTVTVLPNNTYQFSVMLRSPAKSGRYSSYWRLKDTEGNFFGHKLWCEIEVKSLTPLLQYPANHTFPSPNPMLPFHAQPLPPYAAYPSAPMRANQMRYYNGNCAAQRNIPHSAFPGAMYQGAYHGGQAPPPMYGEIPHWSKRSVGGPYQKDNAEPASSSTQTNDNTLSLDQSPRLANLRKLYASRQQTLLEKERKARLTRVEVVDATKPVPVTVEEEKAPQQAGPINPSPASDKAPTPTTAEEKMEGSGMVFPKLEKESPTSSTHDIASPLVPSSAASAITAPESAVVEPMKATLTDAATETGTETLGDEETFEDVANMALNEQSSDDDAFLTDEEYDILDASDEEVR